MPRCAGSLAPTQPHRVKPLVGVVLGHRARKMPVPCPLDTHASLEKVFRPEARTAIGEICLVGNSGVLRPGGRDAVAAFGQVLPRGSSANALAKVRELGSGATNRLWWSGH